MASNHPTTIILEPRMQYADIGNFLSFLTVNQIERDEKVMMLANEMEPLIREMKIK